MNNKITICHLGNPWSPVISGGAIRLYNLLKFFPGNYPIFKLNIIAEVKNSSLSNRQTGDIKVFYVEKNQNLLKKFFQYRKILKKQKIDLIHSHNLRVSLMGFLILPFCPQILEIHSPQELSFYKKIIARWLFKKVAKIIVLPERTKKYFIENFRLNPKKIEIVYNGRLDIEETIERNFKSKNQYTLGYFGGFEPWDGIYQLVEALADLLGTRNNIKLILIGGGGADFEKNKKYVEQNKLENKVTIRSMVNPEEIGRYYQEIDIFILPRISVLATETAVPLKILEALAYGLPIIATKVGGLTEVLTDNFDSILVELGNKTALIQAINQLLDNPSKMEELSRNTQLTIQKWPTWRDSAEKLFKIYEKILTK